MSYGVGTYGVATYGEADGALTVSPTAIGSTVSIQVPSFTGGALTVSPTVLGSTLTVRTPSLAGGALTPAAIGSTFSIRTPSFAGGSDSPVVVRPTVLVEVAFGSNPGDASPTWTDVSTYAREFLTDRGRSFELDQMKTGTASVTLANRDRRFEPFYSGGLYYPNVKPGRRLRIRATWAGQTYPIFSGYVEEWPISWSLNWQESRVPVNDGFAVLAAAQLNETYGSELSSARVNNVLTDVGWGSGQAWVLGDPTLGVLATTTILGPVGDRSIGIGQTTLQASTLANVGALTHLQLVAETENGLLFMGRDGALVFMGRQARIRPPYTNSQVTFGDSGGSDELPYADLTMGQSLIWNEIRLTRQGGTEQVASNGSSITSYFRRTDSKSGLLHSTDSEVAVAASWRLNRYREPSARITSLVLKPMTDPSRLWPAILARELGDRVTVKRRPMAGGPVITQESFIEGIAHEVTADDWTVRFQLSPADTATYWILGNGVLATSTRLAY